VCLLGSQDVLNLVSRAKRASPPLQYRLDFYCQQA